MAKTNMFGRVKRGVKLHLVDATALLAESTPVLAAFETVIAGMSVQVSVNARVIAATLTYFGGTGYIYAKGRDFSRQVFRIRDESKEKTQHFHDSVYLGGFNLAIAPLLYLASGARDMNEISLGTATAVLFGLVNGGPMGYAVDMFRDLTSLKECNRPWYPELLKTQNQTVKKILFALFTVLALVGTWCIYLLNGNR